MIIQFFFIEKFKYSPRIIISFVLVQSYIENKTISANSTFKVE